MISAMQMKPVALKQSPSGDLLMASKSLSHAVQWYKAHPEWWKPRWNEYTE